MGVLSKADDLGVAIHTKSQACGMELGVQVQLCRVSTRICPSVGLGMMAVPAETFFSFSSRQISQWP